MYKKVSVLIPTRHRVHRLRTVLTSYDNTKEGDHASELIFRVDADDTVTQEFLAQHWGTYRQDKKNDRKRYPHRVIVGPRLRGYDSMPEFFNECYRASVGDVLMCGNDDIIFRTPRWAQTLLERANQFPDGIFNLGVRTLNEDHYPFGITSRKMADALGFYWDPTIFWGDIYLRDIAAHFGRCVKVPEVEIVHDWAGNNPDQVFMESNKDITGRDPNYWNVTHRNAVNAAIEKLKGVYDQHLRTSAQTV